MWRGMRIIALIVLVLLIAAPSSWAADTYCGVDTDRSGTIDFWCPAPDADRDAYFTDGLGPNAGTDCNDFDAMVYPGIITGVDCPAGQFHTCQSDGTYTACAALSTFTCHTGSGATYWIDSAETTCAGTGAFADPIALNCISDTGMGGYHAPVAGDCFVLRGGTYDDTWGSSPVKMIYVANKDGNSTNKITFRGAPGEEAIIEGQGTSPNVVHPFRLELSNYWFITQLTIRDGYSTNGIWVNGSENVEVSNVKAYDLDGNCGTDNCGGVMFDQGPHYVFVHHNYFADNYNRASPLNQNNVVGVDGFQADHLRIDDNQAVCTRSGGCGYGYRIKHGTATGGDSISRNFTNHNYWAGISSSTSNIQIYNNFIADGEPNPNKNDGAISIVELGGPFYPVNVDIQYNTAVNSWALLYNPSTLYTSIGLLTYKNNVVVDNRATPYQLAADYGFLSICTYCSDTLYNDVVVGGLLDLDENCYFNDQAQTLYFSLFGASSGGGGPTGAFYSGFSNWVSGTGYDSGSFNEDPDFDSYYIAQSANCASKGWRQFTAPPTIQWGILSNRLTRYNRR